MEPLRSLLGVKLDLVTYSPPVILVHAGLHSNSDQYCALVKRPISQDELYLEVTLDSPDPSLALHISDAVASNSPVFDPESDQQYDIIKDG